MFRLDKRTNILLDEIRSAFLTPTLKQKEAYGRFSHTVSAACTIGAVSLAFTESTNTSSAASKVFALVFWAVILFVVGSVLSKGE